MSDATFTSSTAAIGKSERLKNQIRNLRNEIDVESKEILEEIDSSNRKKATLALKQNIREAMNPTEKFP
jgi:hypothetical protein